MKSKTYDFANILFAGPCNLRCPYCIGKQVDQALNRNNLDEFPLRNVDTFTALLRRHRIRQVILTGTTTDPALPPRGPADPLAEEAPARGPAIAAHQRTTGTGEDGCRQSIRPHVALPPDLRS